MLRFIAFRPRHYRQSFVARSPKGLPLRRLTFGFTLAAAGAFAFSSTIHLDAPQAERTVVDPATGIEFPETLHIPARFPLPKYTLLGVGVRKVSFLGVKVYSVGFFADLSDVPPISHNASFDEKIRHLVEHSSCALRIIPTRSTSYTHLRDGFMRALDARMIMHKSKGLITPEEESRAVSPLLKFKAVFPATPLTKHTPLDIILTPMNDPVANIKESGQRRLIVRDLGSVSNNWVAKQFMLAYFEGQGISPPLKQAVEERLRDFGN